MKLIEKKKEIKPLTDVQYGISLEKSASALTQGYGRRIAEATGRMMV